MTLALAILIALLVGVCVGVGGTLWFVAKEADADEERVLISYAGGGNGRSHDLQVVVERNGHRWWLWMENPRTGLRSRLRDPRYYGHPDSWSSLNSARAAAAAGGTVEKIPK